MMMEPELNKVITDKYGEERHWQIVKVTKVALIADHTKKNSDIWYELNLFVRVDDKEPGKEFLDEIQMRIDIPNMFTADRYKERKEDMKVTLIKYEQRF
jgi:hypothetical protein